MDVHFTPEQEQKIADVAGISGNDREELVKVATVRLFEEHARFRAAVPEATPMLIKARSSSMMR